MAKSCLNSEFIIELKERLERWKNSVLKERFKGTIEPRFRTGGGTVQTKEIKQEFRTGSGDLVVRPVYTPLDLADCNWDEIGLPGEFPYTRGRDPVGFRAFKWPLSFYSGYGSSKNANERYRSLYAAGARHIYLALDLPTQIGLDSDHPLALGEVGKVGVAIDSISDLEAVMEGLPLDMIHTGSLFNCTGPWGLAMYIVLAERKGYGLGDLRIHMQNDPIKEYTGRGTYIFSPDIAIDLSSDVVEYICKHLPQWEPQYHCTTTLRWGGCSASQEIAFGIANLISYVEAAKGKGVPPGEYMPRINLHMTADNDLFEEVAKFRATRRLWAKIARERFTTEDPRVLGLRISVYTAAYKLTAQEPMNNIIRTTMHVLASMLGGVEEIAVPAHDEALALPTFESTRLANLTKHLLFEECNIGNTADPLGGSYFIESLTDDIEKAALEEYEKVEKLGGAMAAINDGYYLQKMAGGMYRYMKEVENNERNIIGLNKFSLDKEIPIELFKNDPETEQRQKDKLNDTRRRRNGNDVSEALKELRRVAEKKASGFQENIVPAMISAVRSEATVGEIFGVLRDVFGEYKPPAII